MFKDFEDLLKVGSSLMHSSQSCNKNKELHVPKDLNVYMCLIVKEVA